LGGYPPPFWSNTHLFFFFPPFFLFCKRFPLFFSRDRPNKKRGGKISFFFFLSPPPFLSPPTNHVGLSAPFCGFGGGGWFFPRWVWVCSPPFFSFPPNRWARPQFLVPGLPPPFWGVFQWFFLLGCLGHQGSGHWRAGPKHHRGFGLSSLSFLWPVGFFSKGVKGPPSFFGVVGGFRVQGTVVVFSLLFFSLFFPPQLSLGYVLFFFFFFFFFPLKLEFCLFGFPFVF